MIIDVKQNREVYLTNAQNTQNENEAEKITLIVPEQYSEYNKKIVFDTPDGIFWDIVVNNEYLLNKAITKYQQVDFYIWLTQGDVDFRTKTKTLRLYHNTDASGEITPEEISGVNTVVNLLEEEIDKVENIYVNATKLDNVTTITIGKKDGTTETVEILDGEKGDDYVITQADYNAIANIVAQDVNVAKKNQNNNFTTAQTVNGTLTVNGDIVQSGQSYETHAEQLFTQKDIIKTRDGAVGGLASNEFTGIEAIKYDGANNGRLVFDNTGTARVGDVGDEAPLLARDESSNMIDGKILTWDATNLEAKTTIGIVTLTQEEYEALTIKDANTYYYIPEEE